MSDTTAAIEPIVKNVTVPVSPERAFRLFTAEMQAWWPLRTHSVLGESASGIEVDGRVGGTITEIGPEGPAGIWGTFTEWDPPRRFTCDWHPGSPANGASRLKVEFRAAGDGTEVVLTHDRWEQQGQSMRDNYDPGWDVVLAGFVSCAG